MWRSSSPTESLIRKLLRLLVRLSIAGIVCVVVLIGGLLAWRWYDQREPVDPREIFPGITYRCIRVPGGYEQGGLVHICEVDLTHPGVELWTTPVDRSLEKAGWTYRLRRVGTVCESEHLAVVVNGALFMTPARYVPLAGDVARSSETVVSDHLVDHVDPNSYLIWFTDDLLPNLQPSKPPLASNLAAAKWGIGVQDVTLFNGEPRPGTGQTPDRRTMIAFNAETKKLWLATFERASARSSAQLLADLGAKVGGLIDGGTSTSMALGSGAHGVKPGLLIGGLRPVATQFGVKVKETR